MCADAALRYKETTPPCPAAFSVGYTTISGAAYLAALDLVCSDGVTVQDPGPNATFRASLNFSTTPAAPSGSLLSQASLASGDAFTDFQAGADANLTDTLLNCSGSNGFLGATTKRWVAGENGTLGDDYTDATK